MKSCSNINRRIELLSTSVSGAANRRRAGACFLAVATHNTDVGDGWEREAEGEWHFEKYSTLSYAMGFNIIVYALTH